MSVTLMARVWPMDIPTTDKMVLLALADAANDDGVTWIAVSSRKKGEKLDILTKCSLGERAVQGAIQRLKAQGFLERKENPGKGVIYTIKPPQQMRPAADAPPQQTTQTPAADAGKPSVTIIVESETREAAILALPQWSAFKAMRKQIKKPVNPTAERRLLSKLISLEDDGYPPGEVLDQSTEHCWQGVFKIEEQEDGRTINRANIRSAGGPRPDPTLAIVRAAVEAQRAGCGDYR